MKMTEKTKRRLTIGGGIAICAGLLAVISLQFAKTPVREDVLPEKESRAGVENAESAELAIQPVQTEPPEQTDPPVQTEPPKPTDPPAQTEPPEQIIQPKQSIQPEVERPQQPDEETLTNPEEKPDGTRVDTTPEPVDHDTYVPSADDRGGNSGGGLPGFDYVPNKGENIETYSENIYENGNKIGSMD